VNPESSEIDAIELPAIRIQGEHLALDRIGFNPQRVAGGEAHLPMRWQQDGTLDAATHLQAKDVVDIAVVLCADGDRHRAGNGRINRTSPRALQVASGGRRHQREERDRACDPVIHGRQTCGYRSSRRVLDHGNLGNLAGDPVDAPRRRERPASIDRLSRPDDARAGELDEATDDALV
jgi:hypothetical protein